MKTLERIDYKQMAYNFACILDQNLGSNEMVSMLKTLKEGPLRMSDLTLNANELNESWRETLDLFLGDNNRGAIAEYNGLYARVLSFAHKMRFWVPEEHPSVLPHKRHLQQEFPQFIVGVVTPLPEGLVNSTWRNDVCPSFLHEDSGLTIWVDDYNPLRRESWNSSNGLSPLPYGTIPVGCERFLMTEMDAAHQPVLQTDDWWRIKKEFEKRVKLVDREPQEKEVK